MCSKFVLAIRFCSAEMAILVGKWPMADYYFKLWGTVSTLNEGTNKARRVVYHAFVASHYVSLVYKRPFPIPIAICTYVCSM